MISSSSGLAIQVSSLGNELRVSPEKEKGECSATRSPAAKAVDQLIVDENEVAA